MEIIYNILLILHITGGSIGLLCGTISIVRKKGDKIHKITGRFFYYGMLATGISSLLLALIHPNYFLLILGIFTIYMIGTGQRVLQLKTMTGGEQKPSFIDYFFTYSMMIASVAFMGLGIYELIHKNTFGVVFLVFWFLSLRMIKKDIQYYKGKATYKNYWLTTHLQRMAGAYTAAATAFLVVNNTSMLPSFVVWLLPTAILLPFIIKWTRKYR